MILRASSPAASASKRKNCTKISAMVHPVVRTHPETNERLIYVNAAFTDHIVDMEPEESVDLLDKLYKTA